MKNLLAPVLATAALSGCLQTIPTKEGADPAAPSGGSPRPIGTVQAPATPPATKGAITWNVEGCNKDMAVGSAKTTIGGADGACIRMIVGGKPASKGATTAPEATVYTAQVSLPACTAKSGTAYQTAAGIGNRALEIGSSAISGLGGLLGARASQAAGQAAGGGVTGNIAGRAAREAVSGSNGVQQRPSPARGGSSTNEAVAACNNQITELANGSFADGVKQLMADWKASNKGFTPVITITSDLPAAQEKFFVGAANAAAGTPAPRR